MRSRLLRYFILFAELSKIKIPIAVTFSSFTGYVVFKGALDNSVALLTVGVFLLAGGSAALNQFQEARFDIKMQRTQNRPVASGRLKGRFSLWFSIILIFLGSVILCVWCGLIPCLIGLLTMAWYNGIYTPLKTKTVFALIAGAFVGAFPPLIGWTAAGGNIFDREILLISALLFVWQVPHFMLLMLKYGKEYEVAGFSVLTTYLSDSQIQRIILIWILATAVSVVVIPVSGFVGSMVISMLLMISAAWLVMAFIFMLKKSHINIRSAFIQVNLFLIVVLLLLSADKLI